MRCFIKIPTAAIALIVLFAAPSYATELTAPSIFWNELINSSIFANGVQLQVSTRVSDTRGVPTNISSVTATHLTTGKQYPLYWSPTGNISSPTSAPYIAIPEYKSVPSSSRSGQYKVSVTNKQNKTETKTTYYLRPVSPLVHAQNIQVDGSNEPTTPDISWSRIPGATSYRLTIWDSDDQRIYDSSLKTMPSFTVPSGILKPKHDYEFGLASLDYDDSKHLQRRSETFRQYSSTVSTPNQNIPLTPDQLAAFAWAAYGHVPENMSDYSEDRSFRTIADYGYNARAYKHRTNGQVDRVILTIAGTKDDVDLLADKSFAQDKPTSAFLNDIQQAERDISLLHNKYKNAEIVVTGHSLGGAVAQLVGAANGLKVASFNAPGAKKFIFCSNSNSCPNIRKILGDVTYDPMDITNYRMWGDYVSQVGIQLGRTKTFKPPMNMDVMKAKGLQHYALATHKIKNTVHDLNNGIRLTNDRSDRLSPNQLGDLLFVAPTVINGIITIKEAGHDVAYHAKNAWNFVDVHVKRGIEKMFDPFAGNGYYFIEDKNSPSIASITFPFLLNSEAVFQLQTLVGGDWITKGLFQELQHYHFDLSDTDRFRFFALDYDTRQPLSDLGNFAFGLTFASDGIVNARVLSIDKNIQVPEPNSLFTLLLGLLLLGAAFMVTMRKR